VAYKYVGTAPFDSFSVSLVDEFGAVGAATTVRVNLSTSLIALPSEPPQEVDEEVDGVVYLYAADTSDSPKEVCFEILGVTPSDGLAAPRLFDPEDGSREIFAGDTLMGRPLAAAVVFRGAVDHFTTPTVRWNESSLRIDAASIAYEAFACDEPRRRSVEARQAVSILNVADPANVSVVPNEFSVYALSSIDADDDEYPTRLAIGRSISIFDADRDVDAMRIDVTCEHGLLSLHPDTLHLADFNSQAYCQSRGVVRSWYCRGSGLDDRSMTFVATPSDAATLLSGLSYSSFRENTDDLVTITLYDGEDDRDTGCLAARQYKTRSLRASCAVSEAAVVVHVQEFASVAAADDASSANGKVSWQLALALVAIGLVVSCCSCCYVRRYLRQRRVGQRGGHRDDQDKFDHPETARDKLGMAARSAGSGVGSTSLM